MKPLWPRSPTHGSPKKPAPKHVEPEEESQEVPEEEPDTEEDEETGGKAISKAAAVRDALEQGEDGPEDGVAYIKKVHKPWMSRPTFSGCGGARKSRGGHEPTRKRRAPTKPKEASPGLTSTHCQSLGLEQRARPDRVTGDPQATHRRDGG